MKVLYKLLLFVTMLKFGHSQLPPVTDVQLSTAQDGAVISFSEVEGAISYMGILTGHNVTVESATPSLYFSNLDSFTNYEVLITPIDILNQPGLFEIVSFKTGPGLVQNVKVTTVSSSLLTIEWDIMEDIDGYPIDFSETKVEFVPTGNETDEFKPVPTTIQTSPNSRTFTNLLPFTYYTFRIRAQLGTQLGPESVFQFRTDGSGIRYESVWSDDQQERGASGKIFRSLDVPNGPFEIRVQFPCEIGKFQAWNAHIDLEQSDPLNGLYLLVQREKWQLEKAEIGFVFEYEYYNETDTRERCYFPRDLIFVEFGDDSNDTSFASEVTEKYALNTTIMDWGNGGIIYINVNSVFLDPYQYIMDNETALLEKPQYGLVAFEIKVGSSCSAFRMQHCWNFERVYDFDDPASRAYYFVQTKAHWDTNDIGIVFEYDRFNCVDPRDITVSALVGGDMVRALTESFEMQEFENICTDLQ